MIRPRAAERARQRRPAVPAPVAPARRPCVHCRVMCVRRRTATGHRRPLGEATRRENRSSGRRRSSSPGSMTETSRSTAPRRSEEELKLARSAPGPSEEADDGNNDQPLARGPRSTPCPRMDGIEAPPPSHVRRNGPAAPGTRRAAADHSPPIVGEVCGQMPSRSTASIPGLCRLPRHLRSWPLDCSGEPPKPTHVQFRPSNQG
jgi:hypothetical protein